MKSKITLPQPMHPHGPVGRAFGYLMEWGNAKAYDTALALLAPKPTDRIIEIGFGTGRLLELVAQKLTSGQIAGIDPSSLMVERARKRLAKQGKSPDLKLALADVLPWSSDSFELAAALHCFQFWADPAKTLSEISRVLKNGGSFVLILRNHENARNIDWLPNSYSRHGQEAAHAVELLHKAGFVNIRRLPNVSASPVIMAQKLA